LADAVFTQNLGGTSVKIAKCRGTTMRLQDECGVERSVWRILLICWTALVTAGLVLPACDRAPAPPRFNPTRQTRTVRAAAHDGQDIRMFIDTGSPAEAADYARHIEDVLGFPPSGTLDQLLAFSGYPELTGRDLEILEPDQLHARLPGRLLATRFLAPQIIDVSGVGGAASGKDLGWRKLVRLAIDPASLAGSRRLDALYVLFNVFQPRSEIAADPFIPCRSNVARCSANIQVILVPREVRPGSDALFWFVFENAADGGARGDHLKATFDGGDQASSAGGNPGKPHYLPAACAQCHGGSAAEGRLNYLDSDHWFDRTRPGNDFADFDASSPHGVLFDGGRNTTSAEFTAAFGIVSALNRHIRDQNVAVGGEDFGLRAVEHWLTVHRASSGFIDPISRALPPDPAVSRARQWGSTVEERRLLDDLNRYCFRCHSTVAYHVFDKEAVFRRRESMARRVELGPLRPGGMPQDRTLDGVVAAELARRLRALQ
jgi:hypothetical protein